MNQLRDMRDFLLSCGFEASDAAVSRGTMFALRLRKSRNGCIRLMNFPTDSGLAVAVLDGLT